MDMNNLNENDSNTASGTKRMLFAVPKKGRLYERVLKMLNGSGLDYVRPARVDIAQCTNLPISLVFLPAADIALYVGEGHVDMGITGQDIISESEVDVNVLQQLGFGKCKLAVQAPVANDYTSPKDLCGKRIVTSFPNLAKKYFTDLNPDVVTNIKFVSGSVEAAVRYK
jgi:ATP phosphoribosyltransferase